MALMIFRADWEWAIMGAGGRVKAGDGHLAVKKFGGESGMYRVKYLFCAEGVVVDVQTNSVTVYSLVEEVRTMAFPVVIPKLAICCSMIRDPGDESQPRIILKLTLDDETIFMTNSMVNFSDKPGARIVVNLNGVKITKAGVLKYGVYLQDQMLGENEFRVSLMETPRLAPHRLDS